MRLGAVYPQIELGGDPAALHAIGTGVDALGYDHLVLYDHVVGAVRAGRTRPLNGPYDEKDPFHDPFTAFAYLAAVTREIDLVTGILILPQRQTVLAAKQAIDVDLLSGGRLHLGVGPGWNYVEYDALGQSFETRGARLTEQIDFLRQLWSNPVLSFEGRFDRIERAGLAPQPRRRIPIYCGGFTEVGFRRAARLADGFIFAGGLELSLPWLSRLKALLREEQRDDADFRFQLLLQTETAGGLKPEAALAAAQTWQAHGGTHASAVSMALGFETADQHLQYFAEVWDLVGNIG